IVPIGHPILANWSATIGELKAVRLTDPIWLHWLGYLVIVSPFLFILGRGTRVRVPFLFLILLVAAFLLTMWQARWGYFLAILFVFTIPAQLAVIRPRWLVGIAFALALVPLLQEWNRLLWPND